MVFFGANGYPGGRESFHHRHHNPGVGGSSPSLATITTEDWSPSIRFAKHQRKANADQIPPKKPVTKRTYLPLNRAWSANVNAIQKAAADIASFISLTRLLGAFADPRRTEFAVRNNFKLCG
jgi:hypothetical protein